MTPRSPGAGAAASPPLRVSTLELFFDLVFAFTLTQLSALLDGSVFSATSIVQVLLVFGVLWWMYGGYAWLTNTRTPSRTPERLLLLLGMAGFLVVGLAAPGLGPVRAGHGGAGGHRGHRGPAGRTAGRAGRDDRRGAPHGHFRYQGGAKAAAGRPKLTAVTKITALIRPVANAGPGASPVRVSDARG
jgi:hypothetical protein